MDKESIRRMMDLIDDPALKETMVRVSDNLDRVSRMKDQRENPDEKKQRVRSLQKELDDALLDKVEAARDGIALVLTGGGAKGSFQAGVCSALADLPVAGEISAVAGTSAGALNAALFAGGGPGEQEKVWQDLLESGINGSGGFLSPSLENDRYLEQLIRDSQAVENISMDTILTLVTAFDYDKGWPADFILNNKSEDEKVKCLMASAAFPMALEEQVIRGRSYVDGGIPFFGSNMPVAPLYHMGFRRFLVVHCASLSEAADWADLTGLGIRINQEKYFNGASFVHIFSDKDLGGILEGTINFQHETIVKNIKQGREDMRKQQEDLSALDERQETYDELHVVKGQRFRTYMDLLDYYRRERS